MPAGEFFRRPAVLLVLALCSVGAVVTLLGRLASGPQAEQKRVALSSNAGANAYPAFSADGKRVAYSARGASKGEAFHLFARTLPSGTPLQLTNGESSDIGPAWSPDGARLAFLRIGEGRTEYISIPSDGGVERTLAEFAGAPANTAQPLPAVSWTRDGKSLAVVETGEKQLPAIALVSLADGTVRRITQPPEGTEGDSTPAVSPDGNTLAFVRATGPDSADIYLCDLAGGSLRRLTFDDRAIHGIAWTPDGQDVVYAAQRSGGGWRLWRLPAYGGSPREIAVAGAQAHFPAIATQGRRLAYTDSPSVSAIWRAALGAPDSEERPIIRSLGRETAPAYSPDGKRIADVSDQTGADEIWVSDAEGGNRVRLTSLKGPRVSRVRWSPDGRLLLFEARADRGAEVYTIPAAGGRPDKPHRVPLESSSGAASWSHDGKSIYFQRRGQIWKADANGGNPRQLTNTFGSVSPEESVDGKYVYYRNRRTIWRVPADGGAEEQAIVPEHDMLWIVIQPAKKGVYYLEFASSARAMLVSFYDFATRKNEVAFRIKDADFFQAMSFSVSPDGKYILYPKVDQSQTNVMLVENFR
jgi:Tol biopolymer transport system component